MINLNLKNNNYSKKEVITNEEIEKGIEDSIKNLNTKDDNQKNILKLKLHLFTFQMPIFIINKKN
jgi:hypothetical protein